MQVKSSSIQVTTRGHNEVLDITDEVRAKLAESKVRDGIVTIFVVGSTAGVTTIEFEPGLVHDIAVAFERIAPASGEYKHHEKWGDDNGNSHIRASLLGPSLTVPFNDGKLALGTWQQIVLLDFDTRGRRRELVLQFMGV